MFSNPIDRKQERELSWPTTHNSEKHQKKKSGRTLCAIIASSCYMCAMPFKEFIVKDITLSLAATDNSKTLMREIQISHKAVVVIHQGL